MTQSWDKTFPQSDRVEHASVRFTTRYGFTLAGVASYNHAVGNIFTPAVSLIFSLKTLLFALAVSLLPAATALRDVPRRASRTSVELQGLVQMFVLMLIIEIASLVGNYY